jgi:hypothetical protein
VSNLPTAVDTLTVVAPLAGAYQVEVFGYTAAEYRLIVEVNTSVGGATTEGGVDPSKTIPTAPPVDNAAEPGAQLALDTPGAAASGLYLPVIRR